MQLQKVQIGYNARSKELLGLKFYGKDGAVVLKTGWDWGDRDRYKTHTEYLEEGERVIGYKSRRIPELPNHAWHFDFQLIIGRLE